MIIDMAKTPPTQQEIELEKDNLLKKLTAFKIQLIISYTLATVLILIALVYLWVCNLQNGVQTISNIIIIGVMLGISLTTSPPLSAIFIFGTIAIVVFISQMVTSQIAYIPLFYGFTLTATILLAAIYIQKKRDTIDQLLPLQEDAEECLALAKACRGNEQCEAYRQAVVDQERFFVQGEAAAIIQWYEASGQHKLATEAIRERQVACTALKEKRPIIESVEA